MAFVAFSAGVWFTGIVRSVHFLLFLIESSRVSPYSGRFRLLFDADEEQQCQ